MQLAKLQNKTENKKFLFSNENLNEKIKVFLPSSKSPILFIYMSMKKLKI
jgi:hypothetical protein